jgi:hypothetical protein
MEWVSATEWWMPTFAVAIMAVAAALAARRNWLIPVMAVGALALIGTVWQQAASHSAFTSLATQLSDLSSRLETIGKLLPNGTNTTPKDTDTVAAGIVALSQKIKNLDDQVSVLQQKYKARTIDDAVASLLADYLRGLGTARVVVSCVPDDVEAYGYANRIAEVLRSAGWDALGPETTKVNGDASAMGIQLYVRGEPGQQIAKVLIEAFRKYNIPYQAQISSGETIPDNATVELFIASKP